MDRRNFLRFSAASAGALLARPDAKAAGEPHSEATTDAFGVLVDTTVCIGCRRCEWGCNKKHSLSSLDARAFEDRTVLHAHRRPDATAYTVVNAVPQGQGREPVYGKVQCMHCVSAACASACIVGALRKNPRGPVDYEAWKCIGCRYCMVACPFQIPGYEYANALTPEVRKCTFCADLTLEGKRPACVESCPNEALTFGRRSDLVQLAHSKMQAVPERYNQHVYGEHEVGGTSWMYLAKIDLAALGMPVLGDKPAAALTETIQHAILKGFVPPVALFGLLGLLMLRNHGAGDAGDAGDADDKDMHKNEGDAQP